MENINSWEEKKVVGNIAENIIEFLINSTPNWKCIRFGVENHMEDLKKAVREKLNPVTKKIKSMPDFVAFNTKTGETFFVEAKYRGFVDKRTLGKVEYKLDFLNEYLEYWKGTKLIIVHEHEPYFFVIDLKDVKQEMCRSEQIGQNNWNYYWNFVEIQKEIKELFPELSEDAINKAINMIPRK
ncbi:MAG: hypothetical protein Q7R52_03640 [archaeon]|nr:hypothetical protein [archaeon]